MGSHHHSNIPPIRYCYARMYGGHESKTLSARGQREAGTKCPFHSIGHRRTYYYYMKTNWPLNIYELNAIIASFVCAINPFAVICQYNKYIFSVLFFFGIFFFFHFHLIQSCTPARIAIAYDQRRDWSLRYGVRVSWLRESIDDDHRRRQRQVAHTALCYAKIFINLQTNIYGHSRRCWLLLFQLIQYDPRGGPCRQDLSERKKHTLHCICNDHSIEMDRRPTQ